MDSQAEQTADPEGQAEQTADPEGQDTERNSIASSKETDKQSNKEEKKLGKYSFRLSPEEQDIAYELKAKMFRKLEQQNARVNAEIQMHHTQSRLSSERSRAQSAYHNQVEMTRANVIKLMRLYEKQAVKGQMRIKELETEAEEAQKLAKRYHDMYVAEKEKSGATRSSQAKASPKTQSKAEAKEDREKEIEEEKTDPEKSESEKKDSDREKKTARVTDEDLDDDEAVYKRHVLRVVDTKSMRNTAPIRVADIIRKNEVLLVENEKLRQEVKRLKFDNAQLIKKYKDAETEKNKVLHTVGTSECARADLQRRLERERREHARLQRSLTRQAAEWVQIRKEMQEQDESRRWTTVTHLSPFESQARTYQHPAKKNTDLPRMMFPAAHS